MPGQHLEASILHRGRKAPSARCTPTQAPSRTPNPAAPLPCSQLLADEAAAFMGVGDVVFKGNKTLPAPRVTADSGRSSSSTMPSSY